MSLKEYEGVYQKCAEERKEIHEMRYSAEVARARANDPYQAYKAEVDAEDKKNDTDDKK